MKLEISDGKFMLGGKPIQILSGALHYFRIVPQYWRDRLEKLKMCGFNTVETYIAWNVTEPEKDVFTTEGMADFVKFIEIAEELGLYVIVRPGPFICAEWDMGGFPAYLTEIDGLELRAGNRQYIERFDKYLDFVIPKIVAHLSTNGGNIIAVQVENEYGGFSKQDRSYLEYVRDGMIRRGVDVLLFTSDGADEKAQISGSTDDMYKTVNFGSRQEQAYELMQKIQPDKPFFCMEFWAGWFDQWGVPHHEREAKSVMDEYVPMVERGSSVNFYMFHGGTNFGFTNGSNCNPNFEPTITSYDYCAPLNEYGDITPTYLQIQKFLSGYLKKELPVPEPVKRAAYGEIKFSGMARLFSSLESCSELYRDSPVKNMEYFGQYKGYIMYTFNVEGIEGILDVGEIHDRALVYVDGEFVGETERGGKSDEISISGKEMCILAENMGHVNYGPKIYDKKGIVSDVKIGGRVIDKADINTLPMDDLSKIEYERIEKTPYPVFCKGEFIAEDIADTFLKLDGFKDGFAVINGFNLGRYKSKGPQRTLYVPAPLIKKGKNEVVVFDLYGVCEPKGELTDEHILNSIG